MTALGLALPALLLTQALTSCGDDGGTATSCVPNSSKDCPVPGQDCDGSQTCNAEGTGYSACSCETAGAGGTSQGTGGSSQATAGAAGSSSGPEDQIPEGVGEPCESDSDCRTTEDGTALLTCITSSSNDAFGIGGPQGGYCSLPCTGNAECQAVDALAGCANLPNGGYCIALCTPGAGTLKCGADRAQACFQTSTDPNDIGGCFPMCTSDAACGGGRFCDFSDAGLGLCRDEAPQGGGVGAPCTTATEDVDCASGICLTMSANGMPAGTFCSANCTFFSGNGCGYDASIGGVREAACIQSRFTGGRGGDLGFCFEMCDVNTDCTQETWVCNLFNDVEAEMAVGRLGQCVPPALADTPDAGPG
jgi:hypothetical protein